MYHRYRSLISYMFLTVTAAGYLAISKCLSKGLKCNCYIVVILDVACEQAPVGDSRVQSRAKGMNREWSGEEGVCRGACRHSIDAAVP